MQKALCAVSAASIFLPWIQINLFLTTTSADLLVLTLGNGMRSHVLISLGGALFMAGTLALLKWKRAPLLQVAGLVLVPLGFATTMVPASAGAIDHWGAVQVLQMFMGPGAYLGWAAAIGGVVLMLMGWPTPRILRNIFGTLPRDRPGTEAAAPAVRYPAVPAGQIGPAISEMSFSAALETAEGHLAGGDLNAALTWYGRALGISRSNEEKAMSKVRIASVLRSLGRDWEAHTFIMEARQIDPRDISGWSIYLSDRPLAPPSGAAKA